MSLSLKPSFTYRDLFVTYLRPQWRRALVMSVLIITGLGVQLANPQILRIFIDNATTADSPTPLLFAGALFIGLALLNQGISILTTYVSENVAWTATNQLRTDLVAHCLELDMAFHKARTSGELIERIDGDVDALSNFFSQAVVQLLGNGLLIIGVIVLLLREDWRVGCAMAFFTLFALFVLTWIRSRSTPLWVAAREKDAEFFGFISEQLIGTEDIRANGATGYVMQRFHQILRSWFPVGLKASAASYAMWTASSFLFEIGTAMALLLGAYLWSGKAISLGTVYLIYYYVNLLNGPIDQVRNQLQQLQQAGAGIERIKQLFQVSPTIQDHEEKPLPDGALSVTFEDVTFGYNEGEPILHQLNFQLGAGKVLGVLGRTGSGKTTLARLLLRLYDVQEGIIEVGGVPIKQARIRDLRQRIGMVTQDVQLFHATVRDNLTFFNCAISDERILAVLAEVGLSRWYHSLPEGLDTELGSDGEGLSAGEAQLLAFTRVFLSNPGLVILDEASSRLDPATEQLIEQAVSKLLVGRTAIIIAHRLTTIQRADEIMVLADGCIIEHGARAELARDRQSHFYHLLQTGLEDESAQLEQEIQRPV